MAPVWMGTQGLTAALAYSCISSGAARILFLVFILWVRGQEGKDKVVSGLAVTGVFLEGSFPKEGALSASL